MVFRAGEMIFSDWAALPFNGLYTDTFIFHINALNGLPPFEYRDLLQRMAAHLNSKRRGASLWIQVTAPCEWYIMEVKRSLIQGLGLSVPYVVTSRERVPEWTEFSRPPKLWFSTNYNPPVVMQNPLSVSLNELKCIQVLARIQEGLELEIASLTGLNEGDASIALASLNEKKFVTHVRANEVSAIEKSISKQITKPYLKLTRKGLSLAMRSWGVPAGVEFTNRKESGSRRTRTPHRHISRMWPAWLRSAYPNAEIWTGWTEVQIPEISVLPDALAWGRIQGFETLFWLEVGDEHKNCKDIEVISYKRLSEALKLCRRTNIRLVYVQASPRWVRGAVSRGIRYLHSDVAVIMSDRGKLKRLPMVEWGKITMIG